MFISLHENHQTSTGNPISEVERERESQNLRFAESPFVIEVTITANYLSFQKKMKKMASVLCLLTTLVTMNMVVTEAAASTQFQVGGSQLGWRQPGANTTEIYNQWASHNRFLVGDSLYFVYKKDSVLVVDKRSYDLCNTTKPISAFNDGKTVIELDEPGPIYFISGVTEHCRNGQKLIINVMALHPSSRTPPSLSVPPQLFSIDSPAPSPDSNSGFAVTATSISILSALITSTITLLWGTSPLQQFVQ